MKDEVKRGWRARDVKNQRGRGSAGRVVGTSRPRLEGSDRTEDTHVGLNGLALELKVVSVTGHGWGEERGVKSEGKRDDGEEEQTTGQGRASNVGGPFIVSGPRPGRPKSCLPHEEAVSEARPSHRPKQSIPHPCLAWSPPRASVTYPSQSPHSHITIDGNERRDGGVACETGQEASSFFPWGERALQGGNRSRCQRVLVQTCSPLGMSGICGIEALSVSDTHAMLMYRGKGAGKDRRGEGVEGGKGGGVNFG